MGNIQRFEPKVRAIDLGGRVPPHNLEAEAAVLSAMLLCGAETVPIVRAVVRPEHFYSPSNRTICEAIFAVDDEREPVDVQTVGGWIRNADRLQAIGGMSYLSKISDATPAVLHVEAHARIVLSKARRRKVIEEAQGVAAEGYDEKAFDDDDYCADAGARMHRATSALRDSDVLSIRDVLATNMARLRSIGDGGPGGYIPTGLHVLDDAIVGLFPREVTVIAARPSIGKTAIAGNLVVRIARAPVDGEEIGALFFSIEMPREQLVNRMAASEAGINGKRLRDGRLSPSEWTNLDSAAERLEQLPIFFDESRQTVETIRARIRREQARFNRPGRRLGVVVVDYLTLIDPERSSRRSSREEEVGDIAKGLRDVAKETGVHLIELVQLTKDGGKGEMPGLSDIRESGQIEHCAHNVWMLHRPEFYVRDKATMNPELEGLALLHAAKTRDGDQELVRLHFTKYCARFDNPSA